MFPEICKTLKKLAEQSYLKDRGSAYRYTQAYKLQLNLLENLSDLISNLEMIVKDVELCMVSVLPYLSNKQPVPLQVCMNFWVLYLENLYCCIFEEFILLYQFSP